MQFFLTRYLSKIKPPSSEADGAYGRSVRSALPDHASRTGGDFLGLVAEALFMAIGLHALAALVLADLGLPTLLEVAHGFCSWG